MTSVADTFFGSGWRGTRPKFTDERKLVFLKKLSELGNVTTAACTAGVYPHTVQDAKKTDPAFAAAVEIAQMLHNDVIDESVYERAITGLKASKFEKGQWYTSDTVKVYSDALTALYAKRRNPAYRDKIQIDGLENSGVLIIPATIEDPQEWARKFERSNVDDDDEKDPGTT